MFSSFFKNIKSGHIGGLSGRLVMDLTGLPLTQEQEIWLKERVIEDSKLSLPTIENEFSLACDFLFHFYFDCELNLNYEFHNDGTVIPPFLT